MTVVPRRYHSSHTHSSHPVRTVHRTDTENGVASRDISTAFDPGRLAGTDQGHGHPLLVRTVVVVSKTSQPVSHPPRRILGLLRSCYEGSLFPMPFHLNSLPLPCLAIITRSPFLSAPSPRHLFVPPAGASFTCSFWLQALAATRAAGIGAGTGGVVLREVPPGSGVDTCKQVAASGAVESGTHL